MHSLSHSVIQSLQSCSECVLLSIDSNIHINIKSWIIKEFNLSMSILILQLINKMERRLWAGSGSQLELLRSGDIQYILTCSRHARNMFQTCSSHVSDMLTCSRHVPHMFQTCSWHVPDMFLTCYRHAPHMLQTPDMLTCSSHVPHMFLTCSAGSVWENKCLSQCLWTCSGSSPAASW